MNIINGLLDNTFYLLLMYRWSAYHGHAIANVKHVEQSHVHLHVHDEEEEEIYRQWQPATVPYPVG